MSDWCIRCGDSDAVDEEGCCIHCHWAVLTEVSRGLQRFLVYLARWAEFRDWELAHAHQLRPGIMASLTPCS